MNYYIQGDAAKAEQIRAAFEGRFRFGFYNYADQRWEIRGEKWDNTIVTHWMPIVPPRKEEK